MPISPPRRIGVAFAVAAALVLVPSAPSTAAPAVRAYANCDAIHRVYSGGIAKQGVKWNLANGTRRALKGTVKWDTALYEANRKSDRDKDGIACEKS